VLSLIPITLITLAAIAGQLAELAVGACIAAFLGLAAWAGVKLIDSGHQRQP
jgi:hypothetical protein